MHRKKLKSTARDSSARIYEKMKIHDFELGKDEFGVEKLHENARTIPVLNKVNK